MSQHEPARHPTANHKGVPWRSHEVSRIEALSDAVFAFAVTLLIVALEVPETFTELSHKMQGFGAFALSFALLFQIWYAQHTFFRRFGLQDPWTIVLNGALLFLVLFYMYPLKFLFTYLISAFTGGHGMAHLKDGQSVPMVADAAQAKTMMMVYGLGFIAVFGVFSLLYVHVLRKKDDLGLTEVEQFDARDSLGENLLMASVGLLSIVVLLVTRSAGLAGLTYMLIAVTQTVFGFTRSRKRRRLFESSRSQVVG